MTRKIEALSPTEIAEITARQDVADAAHDAATKAARHAFPNFRAYPDGYCVALENAAADYRALIAAIAADFDLENPN